MNFTSITPEQAWQMTLDQLRLEMSTVAFDTWVSSAHFVAFIDRGTNSWHSQRLRQRLVSQPPDQHRQPPADRHPGPAGGSAVHGYGRDA